MADTRQFIVRLSPDLDDRLKLAAHITDQTCAALVREALEAYLTPLEKSSAYKERRAQIIIATTPVTTAPTRKGQP